MVKDLVDIDILTLKHLSKFKDVSIAPIHTAEHILNRTMVNMFGCPRSRNAHIERKKSKCDYLLADCPTNALCHLD